MESRFSCKNCLEISVCTSTRYNYIPKSVSPQETAFPHHYWLPVLESSSYGVSVDPVSLVCGRLVSVQRMKQFVFPETDGRMWFTFRSRFGFGSFWYSSGFGLCLLGQFRPVRSASVWVWTRPVPLPHLRWSSVSGFLELVSTLSSCRTQIKTILGEH